MFLRSLNVFVILCLLGFVVYIIANPIDYFNTTFDGKKVVAHYASDGQLCYDSGKAVGMCLPGREAFALR